MGKIIVGVMGRGTGASPQEIDTAFKLGEQIARRGWVVLSGGRSCGVMDAASRGAKGANGLTIGILPSEDKSIASTYLDIAIVTGLRSARNNINVLTSNVIVACGMGAGTVSEIALALKARKSVVILNAVPEAQAFYKLLNIERVSFVSTVDEAMAEVEKILKSSL
jgi:uncharacterized protein (TIGR00725 family)